MTGWPLPGKYRQIDRVKLVAQQYRTALLNLAPDVCAILDDAATEAGEGWVIPPVAIAGPEDIITVPEAAELVGRSIQWVYAWAAKDRLHRVKTGDDGKIRVVAAAVQEAAAGAPR